MAAKEHWLFWRVDEKLKQLHTINIYVPKQFSTEIIIMLIAFHNIAYPVFCSLVEKMSVYISIISKIL